MNDITLPPDTPPDQPGIIDEPLSEALSRRYLAYALSVITDRALNLWMIKLAGHVLDFEGRRVRHVPIAPWPEAGAARAAAAMLSRVRRAPVAARSLGCGP